ncbi:MAG: phosphatase PAP2 family protein [Ilumatobacteraceae bacterium]
MSVVADQPTLDHRVALGAIVPIDYLAWIRRVTLTCFCIYALIWTRDNGILWDRVGIAKAVAIFLACAFIGRPARQWATLALDLLLYCAMWFAYETTRGAADGRIFGLRFPLQVQAPRNIDRFLFFGHDPNTVLQQHFWRTSVQWWDKVASLTYFTHFIFVPIAMGALWATSHRQWARFMKRFATVIGVACLMFIIFPTAPPWMVANNYHLMPKLSRSTGRGFVAVGLRAAAASWNNAKAWGNAVAAMPSLHASFALIVPAFFLPWIKPVWLKVIVLAFPVLMLTSLVYLAEHWVIDGLIGWAIVGASFLFWNRFEARQRHNRAERSLHALAELS